MEPQRIASLVASARTGDRDAREELIGFHLPFIRQVANRVAHKALDWQNSDELSIALMAFNEALDHYESNRGAGFLTFATTVIRNRLMDYYRKEARVPQPLAATVNLEEPGLELAPSELQEAWNRWELEQEEQRTAQEIDLLVDELSRYGISLADLAAASPKHRDTKATLLRVVRILLSQSDLMQAFKRSRQLPLKELELLTGVSRKVLETGRRYIVAVTVVMNTPELPRVRAHIQLPDLKEVAPDHG